jgi:hypothetical protein
MACKRPFRSEKMSQIRADSQGREGEGQDVEMREE